MKVFRAFVAASQLLLCVAKECSDSLGSCATKQASLMQFKSLNQKKQSLALDSADSVSTKLAVFQKFTDEMIAKYGQTPEQEEAAAPDQDTLDAIYLVLNYIETQMHALLEESHTDDVALAASLSAAYDKCISQYMNETVAQEVLGYQQASQQLEDAHTQCLDDAKTPCGKRCSPYGACVDYDNYRKLDSKALLPGCVTDAQNEPDDLTEAAFGDSFIQAEEGSAKLDKMEQCLEQTKNEWLDPLYTLYAACTRDGDDCANNVTHCDGVQLQFQRKRCLYATESNLRCEQLTTCFDHVDTECPDKCNSIQTRAAARAADNETGQRLICLLHNLFGKPTADSLASPATFEDRPSAEDRPAGLEACKDQNIDVGYWNIECQCPNPSDTPTETNGYTCPTTPVTKPCQTGFISEVQWKTTFQWPNPHCDELSARGAEKAINMDHCQNTYEDICMGLSS